MKKISMLTALIFILTGCFDRVEIEERSLITAIAFDCTDTNQISLSLEVPYPTALAGSENASEDIEKLKTVNTSTALSIDTALQTLNSESPKNLYFGHTKSCVLSENILKNPKLFRQIIDFLKKDKEINRCINIISTKSEPDKILNTRTDNQPLFGVFLNDYYKNSNLTENLSQTLPLDLNTLLRSLISTSNAAIPLVYLDGDSVVLSDLAVIKNYKLQGTLNAFETEGYLYLTKHNPTGAISIFSDDAMLPVTVTSSHTSFSLDPSSMVCTINVSVKGKTDAYTDTELSSLCNEKIKNTIAKTLEALQKKYKTDCISYSEYVRKNYPDLYNNYSDNTNNLFLDTTFRINVSSSVSNSPDRL